MCERRTRIRARNRLWEIEAARGDELSALLDLRKSDARPGPLTVTVLADLEPALRPEHPRLRFNIGNPVASTSCTTPRRSPWRMAAATSPLSIGAVSSLSPASSCPLVALEQPVAGVLIGDDKTIEQQDW